MIGTLISLLVICVILGVIWVIMQRIPIPADIKWLADVIFLIVALCALVAVLTGYWAFPIGHTYLR